METYYIDKHSKKEIKTRLANLQEGDILYKKISIDNVFFTRMFICLEPPCHKNELEVIAMISNTEEVLSKKPDLLNYIWASKPIKVRLSIDNFLSSTVHFELAKKENA